MKNSLSILFALAVLGSTPALAPGLFSSPALAAPPDVTSLRPVNYEFVAWSTDSAYILFKLQDPNIPGLIFQVRVAETGEILSMGSKKAVFPSQSAPGSDEEKKFVKQILTGTKVKVNGEAVKFDQAGVSDSTHPTKSDIMLLTGQKGDKFVIMGVRGERSSRYDSFDLLKDKTGAVAKAYQKALVWDNDGKNFVLIYHQNLDSKDTPFEGDFFSIQKFKSSKVKSASTEE